MGIEKEQSDNAEPPKRKVGRPVSKVRKERTQAQLASDAKCRERMQKLHEQRRQNLQIKEEPSQKEELPEPNEPIPERAPPRGSDPDTPELESPTKESKPKQEPEEDSSSSSDEEIIIKRKPKKKKKKKRIIYEETSSESEEEKKPRRKHTPPETIEKKQPELKPPKMQRQVAEEMPTFTFF